MVHERFEPRSGCAGDAADWSILGSGAGEELERRGVWAVLVYVGTPGTFEL